MKKNSKRPNSGSSTGDGVNFNLLKKIFYPIKIYFLYRLNQSETSDFF